MKNVKKISIGTRRAGLRHVRRVRPNRAADLKGPPFWTLKISV